MIATVRRDLKAAAVFRGLTGRELARRTGLNEFTVSRILNGHLHDPHKVAKVTAAILGAIDEAA